VAHLIQQGAGTTTLTGTNTYSGGTSITAGTLQIGAAGTSGSITGAVTNSGTLIFDRSDAIDFFRASSAEVAMSFSRARAPPP
jgi:fibronectin-binding autotransporter adhesin